MPWQEDHKEQTHQRILDAAAAAFREHGVAGIGIADIMRRAGLTHGGFYAHFKSKDELVAEVLGAMAARRARTAEAVAERPSDEKLMAVAEAYLTSRHREHPESGCMIAAIGGELARMAGPAKQSFGGNIRAWLDQLAEYAPADGADARRQQATGTYAAMIGGMILARGVEDPHEADRILADVRAFLQDTVGTVGTTRKRRPKK
jgi:TetR/AcrR family transcriptional repressor of nem operon